VCPLDGGRKQDPRFGQPPLIEQDYAFAVQRLDENVRQLQPLRERQRPLQ
jgi:hypothetical protein